MRPLLSTISRAVFLAVSWTWVIGMFFPVLLVKDFGVWSFLPFAVANVLGAMSVGLVLSSEKAKSAYASDVGARAAFSIATIAFQVFFIAGLAGAHLPGIADHAPTIGSGDGQFELNAPELSAVAVLIMLMIPYAFARRERPEWVRGLLAVVVFLVSLACAALAYFTTKSGNAYATPRLEGEFGLGAMAFAATGVAFGFALCPYLDQSIVRIRKVTPGVRGRVVSILGFGVFFLSMIFFTLAYAEAFLGRAWLSSYFLLHIFVQAMFTTGVHMGELRRLGEHHARVSGATLFWGTLVACGVASGVGVFTINEGVSLARTRAFVLAYQCFLSLYGLAFPLYVWAVMCPLPGLRGRPRRARIMAFWATLCVASVPFGIGYLKPAWWLVGVGVAVALVLPFGVARVVGSGGATGGATGGASGGAQTPAKTG